MTELHATESKPSAKEQADRAGLTERTALRVVITNSGRTIPIDLSDISGSLGPGPPLVGDALVWLNAAKHVQQRVDASGALDVAGVDAHLIEIRGLARGGRATAFKEQALRSIGPTLSKFSNLAAHFSMKARNNSEPGSTSEKLFTHSTALLRKLASRAEIVGGARIERTARPEPDAPKSAWLYPSHNKVVLHDRSDHLGPDAFSTKLDYAAFVIAHELGHVVQAAHGKSDPATFAGIIGTGHRRDALTAIGLTDVDAKFNANHSFENAATYLIGENYADVFSALILSGSDRPALLAHISSTFQARADHFPLDTTQYDTLRGHVYHDTREALTALREHVESGLALPSGATAIHEATINFAQIGVLRWAAKLATSQAGTIAIQARARLLASMPGLTPSEAAAALSNAAGGAPRVELAGAPQRFRVQKKLSFRKKTQATPVAAINPKHS